MKKFLVLLVLGLFLMSAVPAFAESDRSTDAASRSGSSGTGAMEVPDDNDDDDNESDADDDEGDADNQRQRMKAAEKIRTAGLEVENRVDRRIRQREHFEAAIEKCKEVRDAEDCEENLRERLGLVEKLEEKDIERLEKIREKREEIAAKLEELKNKEHFAQFKLEKAKARILANEKMENAEKNFNEAQQRFEEARDKQKIERDAFVEARTKWKATCESSSPDSEECRALDVELKEHVTKYILHALDSITTELEKLKFRIEGSDTLTEEEATKMLAYIDAKLAAVETLREKAGSELTKEELQAAVEEVRMLWNEVKHDLKMHAGRVVNSRMGGILVQSEKMSVKLTKVLERMAEQGADTSSVESLVDQFNAHLDASKAAYEEAQNLFKEAAKLQGDERGNKIKEAQARMKAAQDALKEAHKVLQEIQKELKGQRQLETLEDVEEDEIEVEAEGDDENDADDEEDEEPEEDSEDQ